MEHLLNCDWCYTGHEKFFLNEAELDNCVTERIINNRFRDPMISSDSEEEDRPTFNWHSIFSKERKNAINLNRKYVPGMRGVPPYPKLSALNGQQQFQCLKVLCAQSPHVLESEFIPRPRKEDYKLFEALLVTYAKEQKEFIEWAKNLWTTEHCIRALRPKPPVETAYDAEFNIKAKEMNSFPKTYRMAAQIPLETRNDEFNMICEKELIGVDISVLPEIKNPQPIKQMLSIMNNYSAPVPCTKHPCRFVLPNDSSTTILPLTEVHRELAQYALDNGAEFIASEKALKCLVEVDRGWTINLSVCEAYSMDGEKRSVLVLGGELMVRRETSQIRTYRAFRHLLQQALVPEDEMVKLRYKRNDGPSDIARPRRPVQHRRISKDSSDDEDLNLVIVDEEAQTDSNSDTDQMQTDELIAKLKSRPVKHTKAMRKKKKEFYKCTCTDTLYERPPPRSFKKWRLSNLGTGENYDVIIHCSHKLKNENGEVLLEPIPEYQIDLGVSKLSEEKHKSFALSLNLRKNASLMTVRVDGPSGEVFLLETASQGQHALEHGDQTSDIAHTITAALGQLQHLLPGHYLLHHEVSHGRNALLYAAGFGSGDTVSLDFDSLQPPSDVEESLGVKVPPTIEPVLLPYHKARKILPCAFTPFEKQVSKQAQKLATRQRQPPSAISLEAEAGSGAKVKWPKNKKKRGKKGKT